MFAILLTAGAPERFSQKDVVLLVCVEGIRHMVEFFSSLRDIPIAELQIGVGDRLFAGSLFSVKRADNLAIDAVAVRLRFQERRCALKPECAGDHRDFFQNVGR